MVLETITNYGPIQNEIPKELLKIILETLYIAFI